MVTVHLIDHRCSRITYHVLPNSHRASTRRLDRPTPRSAISSTAPCRSFHPITHCNQPPPPARLYALLFLLLLAAAAAAAGMAGSPPGVEKGVALRIRQRVMDSATR